MTTQSPSSETPDSIGLSSQIAFYDVGEVLLTSAPFPQMHKGIFFISTPTHRATEEDREVLRERFKIRTIIDTRHPKQPRYLLGPKPGKHTTENYSITDFLGLKKCHIYLRYGDYVRNAINDLPFWSRLRFEYLAMTASDFNNSKLLRTAQDLIWKRDSIDDSFAVLTTSAPLIGRLFSEVLCEAKSYPILMSGDVMIRDNALLMFLLLLLLEVSIDTIEDIYLRITEGLPCHFDKAVVEETPMMRAWTANRKFWARKLLHLLEAKYGSISAYLDVAGVGQTTRDSIKKILLISNEKTLLDVTTT